MQVIEINLNFIEIKEHLDISILRSSMAIDSFTDRIVMFVFLFTLLSTTTLPFHERDKFPFEYKPKRERSNGLKLF